MQKFKIGEIVWHKLSCEELMVVDLGIKQTFVNKEIVEKETYMCRTIKYEIIAFNKFELVSDEELLHNTEH